MVIVINGGGGNNANGFDSSTTLGRDMITEGKNSRDKSLYISREVI
mgnify:CR=1 FL=1